MAFFKSLKPFRVVVEATASYEWLLALLEPLADRVVLEADRFVLDQLLWEFRSYTEQMKEADKRWNEFAKDAPVKEAKARAILRTISGVAPVTVDVVVNELGDIRRFRSPKKVGAYSGLVPGQWESAGRSRELGITKEGPQLLRWILVQSAWRLTNTTGRWRRIFEELTKRRGKKKAIVAVARRLLCVMASILRSGRIIRR